MTTHRTYCRICESLCGLVATVEDDRIVKVRPDPDHPVSKGFACPKGIAMADVVHDPDRILHPLRRKPGVPRGVGELEAFERVSWDTALDDIGRRLKTIVGAHGGHAVGAYVGNPVYFSYSAPMWMKGFFDALKSPHFYSPGSQDGTSRVAASMFLYGSGTRFPIPDLARTDFLLMLGANPFVSKGSLITAPRIRDRLYDITRRGGRVVVVDPRRTETARAFEHLPVRPDTDAWLLLALMHVIFAEGLADRAALARQAAGAAALEALAADFPPSLAARWTGLPEDTIVQLARDLAAAPSAAVYGRVGTCRGRNGTLVCFLLDALAVITGNFDRPGGNVIGQALVPAAAMRAAESFGTFRSRIGNFRDLYGMMPAGIMAREITTPGPGQMRAMFMIGGNPLLSCPNGPELAEAMQSLDLTVAMDFYLSESGAHADYVLPTTTFLEREDFPLTFATMHLTPHVEWTEPVIAPRGEARQEWEILQAIADRIGIVPSSIPAARALGRLGLKFRPRTLADIALRLGPEGDLFGLRRRGLSVAKLRRAPGGVVLAAHQPTGLAAKAILHRDGRVHLDEPEMLAEARRLEDNRAAPGFPMALIGVRELRSHNTWMHNPAKLMTGDRQPRARVHPADAADLGLADESMVRIVSRTGQVEVPVLVTDEILRGTVAVPHGWGHTGEGSWQRANSVPGVNVNVLFSTRVEDLERVAGMTFMDGLPVRLEAVT